MLFERNCSFNSYFRWSLVLISGRLALKSYLFLVLHQSLASSMRYITMRFTCLATPIFTTLKYCFISHKKFSSSLEFFSPLKDFGSSTLGLNVLAPLEVFLTSRFRMTIVSSAASNRSLDFTVREMYKLPVLSMLLFPQSINDRAFFTLFTNHSWIAFMTLGYTILKSIVLWYCLSQG